MHKILKLTTIAAISTIVTVSVAAPAFAHISFNGKVANGRSYNGKVANGLSYNGKVANGLKLNGLKLNGTAGAETPITPVVASVRLADGSVIAVK